MSVKIKKKYDIEGYIVYADENEIRYCNYCGKPLINGMTDWDKFWTHEECFETYMDQIYGKGKWKGVENSEEDEYGGYYLYLNNKSEWVGTGIFYTEWWDDYDVDWVYKNGTPYKVFEYVRGTEVNKQEGYDYVKICVGINSNGKRVFKTITDLDNYENIIYYV